MDSESDEVPEGDQGGFGGKGGARGCWNCGVRYSTPAQVAAFVKGKRLAIDLSCWVVQCDTQTGPVPPELKQTLYLRNIFYRALRVTSTRYGGALPLFVSDPVLGSQDTVLKNSTRVIRARLMAGLSPLSAVDLEKAVGRLASKPMRRNGPFIQKCNLCLEMFRLMGLPTLIAPGEAEALCAQLTEDDLADAVVTPDGDALCFGARSVIKSLGLKDDRNVDAGKILKSRLLLYRTFDSELIFESCGVATINRLHTWSDLCWTRALQKMGLFSQRDLTI